MPDEPPMSTDPMDKRADTPPPEDRGRMRPLIGWTIAAVVVIGTLMLLGPAGMGNSTATLATVIVVAVIATAIALFLSYRPRGPR